MEPVTHLPPVLAGPILRRITPTSLTLWLATRSPADVRLTLLPESAAPQHFTLDADTPGCTWLTVTPQLHYLLITVALPTSLSTDCWIDYQLSLRLDDDLAAGWQAAADWAPDLCYPGRQNPGFRLPSRVGAVLHGSCRKPHHPGGDGLVEADRLLQRCLADDSGQQPLAPGSDETGPADSGSDHPNNPAWPAMLVMSGDQIYADDVATPMLRAIHRLLERLGVPDETMADLGIDALTHSGDLYRHGDCYFRRERLLPQAERNRALLQVVFGGVRKPIFTSDTAHNHLISLGEYLAIYLLVWSPTPWQLITTDMPAGLSPQEQQQYRDDQATLEQFVRGLPAVRRLLAHLPVAMVFDDHDISDDWNLNRDWEENVYEHPFSRRMIGNGLLTYLINQGWGNCPEAFDPALFPVVQQALTHPGGADHDRLVDQLFRLQDWDYDWPTEPPLVVLDTRTRRWRSESSAHKPSGLIDWEALTDLQHRLRGHSSVLLVSAAPIFGVKLIEVIQRIFTGLGKPLLVDAENWMAHSGTAHGILNVFRHPKTPQHFVVLSGDVHYSFVYDVELRGRSRGPDIWQICSRGLRNTFPDRLLGLLDHLNRWLYSPRSPLNWFTRRRRMRVTPRTPVGTRPGRRLLAAINASRRCGDTRGLA